MASPTTDGAESSVRLADRARGGEREAFDRLIERYLRPLQAWAMARLPPVHAAVFFMMALAAGGQTAAARVEKARAPADMVGSWIAQFSEGPMAGLRAVDLSISLGRNGPEIALTLYRYEVGSAEPAGLEHPPVIEHRVEKGVLYFRTRDTVQLEQGRPPETVEADWNFRVVGKNAGLLGVRDPEQSAERAEGEDAPPLPPLPMKRIR